MAYTYTERKRIRKNFGSRDSVLEIPSLLQMQKDAYTAFLQADVGPKKRTVEGLQAELKSVQTEMKATEKEKIERLERTKETAKFYELYEKTKKERKRQSVQVSVFCSINFFSHK